MLVAIALGLFPNTPLILTASALLRVFTASIGGRRRNRPNNSLRSSLRSGLINSLLSSLFSSLFNSLLSTPISNLYRTPLRATALVVASHPNPSNLVGLNLRGLPYMYPKRASVTVPLWLLPGWAVAVLKPTFLGGTFANQLRAIPRIKQSSTEGELPFIVSRR